MFENSNDSKLKRARHKKASCKICGSPRILKNYEDICSKTCLDNKLHYDNMNIPIIFVKNLFLRCPNENEREKQIATFAGKHKYNLTLLRRKLEVMNSQINCA